MRIDSLSAPAMITWQLTRSCDLACLHCCTDSAPGRALPEELDREQALELARQIIAARVPYVMLAGGEPTLVPYFLDVAEVLGLGGALLKIETNGQNLSEETALRLSRLPVRSLQISLDGATQAVYGRQRPGGSLDKALAAARLVRRLGLPLEVTFAPSRLNLAEADAVISLARDLGAFRFNTGRLMRLGTAAKLWDRLELSEREWSDYYRLLERRERELAGSLELCFRPFSLREELESRGGEAPGTLLVLPDGRVKVSAVLPYVCADVRACGLERAWQAYRLAWRHPRVQEGLRQMLREPSRLAEANRWIDLDPLPVAV